jgi:hypothetical protein
MPDGAHDLRAPKMTQPTSDEDPYVRLVEAIVHRAVQDASGNVMYPGARPPALIERDARAWLLDGREVVTLVELCGCDPEPVLRRVRQRLDARRTS